MMTSLISVLNDPIWVWRFQSFFGVEKVKVSEIDPQKPWNNVEMVKSSNKDQIDKEYFNSQKKDQNLLLYNVHNKFWYHLFKFGGFLGEEVAYALLYSFLVWNVDSVVGRRVFLVGMLTFYIGQALKEFLRWPRPRVPDVVRMETRFDGEFGMPSTHAMMSLSLPVSIIFFTATKPYWLLTVVIGLFCTLLVCSCRLYLGMHSLLDIICGLLISSVIMVTSIPLIDGSETVLVTSSLTPGLGLVLVILSVLVYPAPREVYNPSRADTCLLTAAAWGAHTGTWLSWRSGLITAGAHQYSDLDITSSIICGFMRQIIGTFFLALIYLSVKPVAKRFACLLVGRDMKSINEEPFTPNSSAKIFVDLFGKVTTFALIGMAVTTIVPVMHRSAGCDRPEYWTETFSSS